MKKPINLLGNQDKQQFLANRIKRILKEKRLSAKALAELLGKKQPEISRFLSGTHNFTTHTLFEIEDALGVVLVNIGPYPRVVNTVRFTMPILNLKPIPPLRKFLLSAIPVGSVSLTGKLTILGNGNNKKL